jgi:sulfoxide reductase heme-binding subunit YedZ
MTAGHLLAAPVLSGSSLLWYTTRATGIVALVLLTATVMLGVVGTARAASARWPRVVTAGLHRNLALTSTALIVVHVVTTVVDPFASIGLVAAFVPFSSGYRPLWLSLGAVSFDLLLAVLITSLLRDRLSHRFWRLVHLLVYVSWPVALWHGLGTGTDTRLPAVLAIDFACVAGVGWAIWWRLRLTDHPATRAAGQLALAAVPVLTAIFVLLGPLQPGWARRAGTPVALLGQNSQATPAPSTGGDPAQPVRLVDARFTGHLTVRHGPGRHQRTITITGRTTASAHRYSIVIILRGTAAGAGLSLAGGSVRIGRPGARPAWSGPVVSLAARTLIASVAGRSGRERARFLLIVKGSSVSGTVSLLSEAGA